MAKPTGQIYLMKNVPLNPTYDHTIDFKDKDEQFNYFLGFVDITLDNYTYVRKEREYIAVGLPLERLDHINYLMFRSTQDGRLYYAFVTNKVYVQGNTTQVFFLIDVMQTYQFDYQWKDTYVKQAHVDRWTVDHKPIYSRTEEGLDYGTEYSVESAYRLTQSEDLKWLLVNTVNFTTDGNSGFSVSGGGLEAGAIEPVGSPFISFLVPLPIASYDDSTNGAKAYNVMAVSTSIGNFAKVATYGDLIKLMSKSALGNYIRSITLLPYNPFFNVTVDHTTHQITLGEDLSMNTEGKAYVYTSISFEGTSNWYIQLKNPSIEHLFGGKVLAVTEWNTGLENSLPTAEQWEEIKKNPYTTKRDKRFESKLLCSPFRYNLLTDWRNTPVVYKNEYLTPDELKVMFSNAYSSNTPYRYWIKDYKNDPEGRYTCLTQTTPLEFPITSDAYYSYMLENKNTIQANITNATINALTGTVNGALGGAGVGGAYGAVYGAVTGGVAGALNLQAQMRSENAKQADLKAKPDTVINSTDSAFNVLDKNTDLTFYRMRICCENENIIAQIFHVGGYKVNRMEIPNTRSRTRFNYIQTAGANIVGSFNQADLLRIKEIYDKGITIWHYKLGDFYPLDYSYENIEVNLL